MHAQNLEARRTAYVMQAATLRRAARPGAAAVAHLAPGVIGVLTGCDGDWRRFAVGGRVGWIETGALWGGEDCAGL
jgi:SH3-like domain-containing protein